MSYAAVHRIVTLRRACTHAYITVERRRSQAPTRLVHDRALVLGPLVFRAVHSVFGDRRFRPRQRRVAIVLHFADSTFVFRRRNLLIRRKLYII